MAAHVTIGRVQAGPSRRPRTGHRRRGACSTVALVASHDEPLFLVDIPAIHDRIDHTTESWRRWSALVEWTGAGRERIIRSALALKLLMVRGGAIAATAWLLRAIRENGRGMRTSCTPWTATSPAAVPGRTCRATAEAARGIS